MENLKSFTSFSSTTCCRVKISWPRSHAVQLIYSFYKREDIHFIIVCPRHWSESRGRSWRDCAKDHRDHPFSVILALRVLIPKAHWLVPSALLPNMLYFKAHFSPFFIHEVCFFFLLPKPFAESISIFPSHFVCCVFSKVCPTLCHLSLILLSPSLQ